jgi:hypothetical protein
LATAEAAAALSNATPLLLGKRPRLPQDGSSDGSSNGSSSAFSNGSVEGSEADGVGLSGGLDVGGEGAGDHGGSDPFATEGTDRDASEAPLKVARLACGREDGP